MFLMYTYTGRGQLLCWAKEGGNESAFIMGESFPPVEATHEIILRTKGNYRLCATVRRQDWKIRRLLLFLWFAKDTWVWW